MKVAQTAARSMLLGIAMGTILHLTYGHIPVSVLVLTAVLSALAFADRY